MQTMRGRSQPRISAQPGRPATLLDSESPYGSRRVVIEYDSWTTAAYMHDRKNPIAATWLANHRKAPGDVDLGAPRRVELSYSDKSTLRTLKTASLIVGIVVGPAVASVVIAALPSGWGCGTTRPPLRRRRAASPWWP